MLRALVEQNRTSKSPKHAARKGKPSDEKRTQVPLNCPEVFKLQNKINSNCNDYCIEK